MTLDINLFVDPILTLSSLSYFNHSLDGLLVDGLYNKFSL